MVKNLAMIGNVISKRIHISIILNSLPSFWNMTIITLEINFSNLSLDQLSLLLKTQHDHLNKRKTDELMVVQEKPSSSDKPIRPKPFKNKFNGKFKKNASYQILQGNTVKCFKCKMLRHIQKSYRSRFSNNIYLNNNKHNQQGQNKDIIYIVSEYLFANQDLSRWWVNLGAIGHINKSKE